MDYTPLTVRWLARIGYGARGLVYYGRALLAGLALGLIALAATA